MNHKPTINEDIGEIVHDIERLNAKARSFNLQTIVYLLEMAKLEADRLRRPHEPGNLLGDQ